MNTCSHSKAIDPNVAPQTPGGCSECLALAKEWVSLQKCTTCGHVGCCGSSEGKHAHAHFAETGHPVVRSYQQPDDWYWCYADNIATEPEPAA